MNRSRSLSLGAKLNFSLLAFLLLLGAATSAIIIYGFNRTQDSAQVRSDAALEDGGRLALYAVAGGASEQGGLLFESVGEVGRRSALYLATRPPETSPEPTEPILFETSDAGHLYDADPNRVTDLVVINGVALDDARVQDDIAFSAPLDTIFPVLLQGFEGEVGGRNLDPIAIAFISANGVTRYFPPIGIHQTLPVDADFAQRMASLGPDQDPERRTIWTAPYEDGAGQGLIVTARTPVYDGDAFRGTMEVDVSMASVLAQISQLKPTTRGFAFYIDSAGTLMKSDGVDLLTSEEQTNDELAAFLEGMRANPSDEFRTTDAKIQLGGEDYFIAYSAVPVVGGSLAVAAPLSDITAAAAGIGSGIEDEGTRTLQIMLVAMSALFIAGLAGATYLNRRAIIRPIAELVDATRAVASGDLRTQVSVVRGDELGQLANSFNGMVEQLQESERALEQRVEDRTRELNALLRADAELFQSLSLDAVLQSLVDVAVDVLGADKCLVTLWDRERNTATVRAARNFSAEGLELFSELLPSPGLGSLRDDVEPTVHPGLDEPDLPPAVRAIMELESVSAAMDVPIRSAAGVVLGGYGVAYTKAHEFGADERRLLTALADRAAVAIQNARLLDETQRQAKETEALLRADAELFKSLSLDAVLQTLVDVAVDVLGVDKSVVMLHEGDVDVIRASRNYSADNITAFNRGLANMPHEEPPPEGRKPQVYADMSEAPDFFSKALSREGVKSHMFVPVRDTHRMLGAFGISFMQEHAFTEEEQQLYGALADRAAVAIQNAELYERAQHAASLEERQRLARELHDSVSQALYGIALGTRTARLRLGDDPQNAAEPIDYVMSLAEAGLAEMRALIFELRPESLALEGIVAAIEKQAASIEARYKLAVETKLGDEPDCALGVKEALYRIAQEALHNVVKHAQATHVDVRLEREGSELILTVLDDGRGFDTAASFPGHVGLLSMPERATKLGGTVTFESSTGSGTRVVARVPL